MRANKQPKILYVEDDPVSCELVSGLLQKKGYDVILANDGLSGLRQAQAAPPDLVLVDLGIGQLDGYEMTTLLRSLPSLAHLPIVALTASVQIGDKERALIAGL